MHTTAKLDKGGNGAKKWKKREKVCLEFTDLSDADLKASAAEFDKMLKESEKDLKNLFEEI